jgi:hypothetical protein
MQGSDNKISMVNNARSSNDNMHTHTDQELKTIETYDAFTSAEISGQDLESGKPTKRLSPYKWVLFNDDKKAYKHNHSVHKVRTNLMRTQPDKDYRQALEARMERAEREKNYIEIQKIILEAQLYNQKKDYDQLKDELKDEQERNEKSSSKRTKIQTAIQIGGTVIAVGMLYGFQAILKFGID